MKRLIVLPIVILLTIAVGIASGQTAKIADMWLEHGATDQYGTKGMKILIDFSIENAQGMDGKCIAYFYDSHKKDLRSSAEGFTTTAGTACVSRHFAPENAVEEYEGFELFMPYEAMELAAGPDRYYVKCWVGCYAGTEFKFLSCSRDLPFVGTGPGSDASVSKDATTSDTSRATLTLLSPLTTTKQKYHLRVGVNSESLVTGRKVYLNGNQNANLARGIGLSDNNGYQMEVEQDVMLEEGDNEITVEVATTAGTSTRRYNVTYTVAKPSASIDSIWVELGAVRDDEKGIIVHHRFSIYNSNANDECLASIYRDEIVPGQPPRKVMETVTSADFVSTDDKTSYSDFAVFMPYSSMNLSPNTYYVKSKIVHDVDEANKSLTFSDYIPFTIKDPADEVDDDDDDNGTPDTTATASKRVALVVGNASYTVDSISTSINDANDVAAKLKSMGFHVVLGNDMTHEAFDKAIADFGSLASDADVAVFYYAGHGLQRGGGNYLVPTDATLPYAEKVKYECVDADMIVSMMKKAKQKLMILNPNRSNPFVHKWGDGAQGDGHAAKCTADNMVYVFSQNAGQAADGRNSAFAAALLSNLKPGGNGILDALMRTNRQLREATGKAQTLELTSTLYEDNIFNRQ